MRTAMMILVACAGLVAGCQTKPTTDADRAALSASSTASLQSFTAADPTLQPLLDQSVGYAVFPDVGRAGFIAGGSFGRGEVFERGQRIGFADITQATVGLQAGAQTFSQLVIFLREGDFDRFKANQFAFSGNISAVALTSGGGAAADPSKGVLVFVQTRGGLMAEMSVGGQRFRFQRY